MTYGEFVVTQLLFLMLIPIIVFISSKFFGKYFEKKGENLATKEDIKELTRLTEETKKEFSDKAEELKYRLSTVSQHNLSLKREEMSAIFEFNKLIQSLIHKLNTFKIKEKTLDNYYMIKDTLEEVVSLQHKSTLAHSHLLLFILDEDFRKLLFDHSEALSSYTTEVGIAMKKVYKNFFDTENNLRRNRVDANEINLECDEVHTRFCLQHAPSIKEKYSQIVKLHARLLIYLNRRLSTIDSENKVK